MAIIGGTDYGEWAPNFRYFPTRAMAYYIANDAPMQVRWVNGNLYLLSNGVPAIHMQQFADWLIRRAELGSGI